MALFQDSVSEEDVNNLKNEAEGVSFLTLEYAKTQVKGLNEASSK